MEKRNHIAFGLILCFLFVLFLGWLGLNWFNFTATSLIVLCAISIFYSLLPDIDHKNSTITWWFFGVGVLGLVFGIIELFFKINLVNVYSLLIFSTLLLVVAFISPNLFQHRGLIHSIPVGLLAVVPLFFLFHSLAYCVLGYVAWHSHLLGDGYFWKIK